MRAKGADPGELGGNRGGGINSGNATDSSTPCASCGALCGPGAVYCDGEHHPDGSVDYREAHALCSACLGVMTSSQAALETICARIELSLSWRGNA
jgi:hypothetical protein